MRAAHLLLLLVQLGFGLLIVAGASWALWLVIVAPVIAVLLP
jgi:hypothetical protein